MNCKSKNMNLVMVRFVVVMVLILSFVMPMFSQLPKETKEQKETRLKWWTDARFGMFIHWGLYALPARHEWVKKNERISDEDYQKYFEFFNPDLYHPGEWAKMAKEAGMKYFVITAKHHEGFCLWDSRHTDFKATKTPYGKDLLKPMLQAFRDLGLKVGIYYSLLDWHHPDYTVDLRHPMSDNEGFRKKNKNRDLKKYTEYLHKQVKELLTDFGKIDLMFLDYSFQDPEGKGRNEWQSIELVKMIRKLQPHIIINDRLDLLDVPGGWDFRTPEQFKPREWVKMNGQKVPWETCQTFSGSWGYHRDENTWKSTRQLLALLIDTVSKGGNLLLNVGPTARGTFDRRAKNRLKELGDWMNLHSRSIYGCTQAPEGFKAPENCTLTYNPVLNRIYVHILDWPMGKLHLDGFKGKAVYAQLLNDASEIREAKKKKKSPVLMAAKGSPDTLTLDLPATKPDVVIPVIEIFLK